MCPGASLGLRGQLCCAALQHPGHVWGGPQAWEVLLGLDGSGVCVGNHTSAELAPVRIQALQRLFIELAHRDTDLKNLAFGFFCFFPPSVFQHLCKVEGCC